jgi:hypothetical protein
MTESSDNPGRARRQLTLTAAALAVVALTTLAYIPAIQGGYIWDDDMWVTENPLLAAPDGLSRIWFSHDQPSQYFPMVYTTFLIEYALWELEPAGYHITNVVLHILNALLLWGLGALCAGTSYQAFSYEIKCAGRALCAWTSWWEIFYLILSVGSVDAMMLAEAYSCTAGKWRKVMSIYALGHATLYSLVVLVGALVPVKFLISFELLLIFAAPNILILLVLNGWRYYRLRKPMDLALLGTWLWLGITLGGYFLYLILDVTHDLWTRGVWFSENDVLHIGLILWMIYIALVVAKRVVDAPDLTPETPHDARNGSG